MQFVDPLSNNELLRTDPVLTDVWVETGVRDYCLLLRVVPVKDAIQINQYAQNQLNPIKLNELQTVYEAHNVQSKSIVITSLYIKP